MSFARRERRSSSQVAAHVSMPAQAYRPGLTRLSSARKTAIFPVAADLGRCILQARTPWPPAPSPDLLLNMNRRRLASWLKPDTFASRNSISASPCDHLAVRVFGSAKRAVRMLVFQPHNSWRFHPYVKRTSFGEMKWHM